MPLAAQVFALLAAALHVVFFYMESIVFSRPNVWKAFGVASAADAEAVKPMALNQGFYNLFLAVGVVVGIVLYASDQEDAGTAAVVFGLGCMALAAVVLLASTKGKLARAAAIQGLAPVIALVLIAV